MKLLEENHSLLSLLNFRVEFIGGLCITFDDLGADYEHLMQLTRLGVIIPSYG